jgi:hypothetical protein
VGRKKQIFLRKCWQRKENPLLELTRLENLLLDALLPLEEYLKDMMIVGGWCPYLYAKYVWKFKVPAIPTTTDIDLGVKETGAKSFTVTVYDMLKEGGLDITQLYDDEDFPVEFVKKEGEVSLKLEFITSFFTSDDTLNRFLGDKLACNRIEAFELLLNSAIPLDIPYRDKIMKIQVPSPAVFMYHKGITFVMRDESYKLEKDLFYVYFILRYAPQRKVLLETIAGLKEDEYFEAFKENLNEYLSDYTRPGYRIIRKYLSETADERTIYKEIKDEFADLLKLVNS